MSLKTKVKAGNITNLSDARYCAGMGVDWLGFPADVVNPATFKEITDWVTGPEYVLELSQTTEIDSIRDYPVSIVEISSNQLHLIDQVPHIKWMVRLSLSDWSIRKSELRNYSDKLIYLILESGENDLNILSEIAPHFNLLLNQSDANSISNLLTLPIHGLNVVGEDELKPGLKDFEKLSSILEELEVVD